MLFVGNGAVSWSEQYLPSGLAAIVVATVPLWFIVLDKRQWGYHFSNARIMTGILIGFAGVFMLFSGKGSANLASSHEKVIAFLVLITGTIGWAIGSLYSKYKKVEASVTMKAAVQMLTAGLVALVAAFVTGENKDLHIAAISYQSIIALIYLTTMGSLVGFMSYIWLLSVRPASQVGTYAYVNPAVAVFLGWLVLHETITAPQILALLVILAGVILVNLKKRV
jgi:drug/metabolite transporter (DMT)-like permease